MEKRVFFLIFSLFICKNTLNAKPFHSFKNRETKSWQNNKIKYPKKSGTLANITVTDKTNQALNDSSVIYLRPLADDNYNQIMAALNYSFSHPGTRIRLLAGSFPISKTIVAASISDGAYRQIYFDMEGASNAKNTPDQYCSILKPLFTDAPAFAVQLAKGANFKNIKIDGKFLLPDQLSPLQIDTFKISQWTDGVCRDNPTSPYCGIAVDPFSDPGNFTNNYQMFPSLKKYYLPGMSRSGSTSVNFEGLCIKHFVVDFIVTPSNQQNGEIIHLRHSQIESAKIGYAMCQAQSKQCDVEDIECWMPVHTLFDNLSYGIRHGDGSNAPFVSGVNIANNIHQLFCVYLPSFPGSFEKIYGEGVFKIGMMASALGVHLSDIQIDFQTNNPNTPSPDFFMMIGGVTCTNCMFRLYPPSPAMGRITINSSGIGGNTFIGGSFNKPPACLQFVSTPTNTIFINVAAWDLNKMFSCNVNDPSSHLDSATWSDHVFLTVDKSNFTATLTQHGPGTSQRGKANVGDLIVTEAPLEDQFSSIKQCHIIGYVDAVDGDKIHLSNVAWGVRSGEYSLSGFNAKKGWR